MKRVYVAVTALAASLLWVAAASAQKAMTEAEAKLYEAAKSEGSFNWYTSMMDTERTDRFCRLFEGQYPGVLCRPLRATGGVTFQRLMQEIQANAVEADVFSTNDLTDLIELQSGGNLLAYRQENLQYMIPSLRDMGDPDGYWGISMISPLGIGYNTNLVRAEDAPKNWPDLLDPRWKGQVAIGHPGFSGSIGLWTVAMKQLYGWEFFERLEQNKPQIGRSLADGRNLIVSGERQIAIIGVNNGEEMSRNGTPIKVVYPTDGVLVPPSGTGILAKAPRPNAAKLFSEFMLSEEAARFQADAMRYPMRNDVKAPEGIPDLSTTKTLFVPPETAAEETQKVQDQFRDTFGI